jgi:hypothetical protein
MSLMFGQAESSRTLRRSGTHGLNNADTQADEGEILYKCNSKNEEQCYTVNRNHFYCH